MNARERSLIIDALPNLSIEHVLDMYNTTFSQSRFRITSNVIDNGAFEIRQSDKSKVFDGTDNKKKYNANGEYWRDHKEGGYGYGGFSLFAYLEGIDRFKEQDKLLERIKEMFLDKNYQIDEAKISAGRKSYTANQLSSAGNGVKKEFVAPQRHDHLMSEVLTYLNGRAIPIELLNEAKDYPEGQIYGTETIYGDKRVVFLGPLNSEERSIYGSFKGAGEGSNRDISGFEVSGIENTMEFETVTENGETYEKVKTGTGCFALTEAAVDALSYIALFPNRFAASSNGCGNFKFQYLKATGYIDAGVSVRVAFDADEAGDEAAQKLYNAIYVRSLFLYKFESLLKQRFANYNEDEPNGWKKGFDNWVLNNKITFTFEDGNDLRSKTSPHLMFFNFPFYRPQIEVYEKEESVEIVEYSDNDGNIKTYEKRHRGGSVKTDKVSAPTIYVQFDEEVAKALNIKQQHMFQVSEKSFEAMLRKMVRERPMGAKDWNEVLQRQGVAYLSEFSRLYKQGFKENGQIVLPHIDDTKTPISFYRNMDVRIGAEKFFDKQVNNQTQPQEQKIQHVDLKSLIKNYQEQFKSRERLYVLNEDLEMARRLPEPSEDNNLSKQLQSSDYVQKPTQTMANTDYAKLKQNRQDLKHVVKQEQSKGQVEVKQPSNQPKDFLNTQQLQQARAIQQKQSFAKMIKGATKNVDKKESVEVKQAVEQVVEKQTVTIDGPPLDSYMDDYMFYSSQQEDEEPYFYSENYGI